MTDETTTPNTLPQDQDVGSGDGKGAGSEEVVSVKDQIGQALGKSFESDEQALKAVKDTFSYVGQKGQEVKELQAKLDQVASQPKTEENSGEISAKVDDLQKQLNDANFYAENPDYKPYRGLIEKMGGSPAEVVESDAFKNVYEKAKAHDEFEQSKSVLQTNPRLGQVRNKMTEAREALDNGDEINAAMKATHAVMDAFPTENQQ